MFSYGGVAPFSNDTARKNAMVNRSSSVLTAAESMHRSKRLLSNVEAIERRGPPTVGVGGFPQLANAAICVGRPRDAVLGRRRIGCDRLPLQHHLAVAQTAFEQQQRAGGIDPCLMPDLARGIVEVQALSAVA